MADRLYRLVRQKNWATCLRDIPQASTAEIEYKIKRVKSSLEKRSRAATDIGTGRKDKSTPLHEACHNQAPPEVIRLLIEKGADVNAYVRQSDK
jgi:ankyrin repeat protein